MSQKVILRPMLFELAAMFAAGYVVGKYTSRDVPTIAEARQLALELQPKGEVVDVEAMVGKKPFVSVDSDQIRITLPRRQKR